MELLTSSPVTPVEILTLLFASAALALSIYTFIRQRRSQVFSGTKDFNSAWQLFNQTLVGDKEFLAFERELHPHGDLSEEDIKRIYFYFMRFNVAYSAFKGSGELSMRLAQSALNNEANLSFHDREFIKKHVFGRGYDRGFADKFIKKWAEIEVRQRTLPMLDDNEEEFTSPLRLAPKRLPKVAAAPEKE